MKILSFVYNLNKGGTQRAAINFANSYSILGHESRILTLNNDKESYYNLENNIVTHKYDPHDIKLITEWRPQLIHVHSHGMTVEAFEHIFDIFRNQSQFIETNVFSIPSPWEKKLNKVINLSQWASMLYYYRGGNMQIEISLGNPVNLSLFSEEDYEDSKKFIGFKTEDFVIGRVGQAFEGKWSMQTIDIFEEISKSNSNIKLLLVNPSKKLITRSQLSNHKRNILIIDKAASDFELKRLYKSMDCFLHITRQGESFGMVLVEAMASGVPIVTLSTPWGDNSQIEVCGGHDLGGGFVVSSRKGLLDAVTNLIENKKIKKNIMHQASYHSRRYEQIYLSNRLLESVLDKKKFVKKKNIYKESFNNFYELPNRITKKIFYSRYSLIRSFTKFTTGFFFHETKQNMILIMRKIYFEK